MVLLSSSVENFAFMRNHVMESVKWIRGYFSFYLSPFLSLWRMSIVLEFGTDDGEIVEKPLKNSQSVSVSIGQLLTIGSSIIQHKLFRLESLVCVLRTTPMEPAIATV